jgi:lysophospholipase L1-like esterase
MRDVKDNGSYRGWSRRLAQKIANAQGGLLYANFGVRGRTTREILEQQVPLALDMQPDLVSIFSGTNDVLRRHWNLEAVVRDIESIQRVFLDRGATVITFTLPDLTPIMPMARWLAPRIHAMNAALMELTARTGAIGLDFASYAVATDPRLWDRDRIHANEMGHMRIANALAYALQLPASDASWGEPLPFQRALSTAQRMQAEVMWTARYVLPWLGRRLRFRPKRQRQRIFPTSLAYVSPVRNVRDVED